MGRPRREDIDPNLSKAERAREISRLRYLEIRQKRIAEGWVPHGGRPSKAKKVGKGPKGLKQLLGDTGFDFQELSRLLQCTPKQASNICNWEINKHFLVVKVGGQVVCIPLPEPLSDEDIIEVYKKTKPIAIGPLV